MSRFEGLHHSLSSKNKISETLHAKSLVNDEKRYSLKKDKERYKVDSDGCWVWQLRIMPSGYGSFSYRPDKQKTSRTTTAHRYFYKKYKGEIPQGFDVHHKCFNRSCVNPEHLEAVTREVNMKNIQPRFTHRELRKILCSECVKKINLLKQNDAN